LRISKTKYRASEVIDHMFGGSPNMLYKP